MSLLFLDTMVASQLPSLFTAGHTERSLKSTASRQRHPHSLAVLPTLAIGILGALRCFEAFKYFSSGIRCFEDWSLPLFQWHEISMSVWFFLPKRTARKMLRSHVNFQLPTCRGSVSTGLFVKTCRFSKMKA